MKRMLVALGILALVCTAAQAQETEAGSELKRFDVWVGDWALEVEGKDIKSGEPWRLEGTVQISRLGESFYVRHVKGKEQEIIVVMGYDPVRKSYFSQGFWSTGVRATSTITFGEKTFNDEWTYVTPTGDKLQERCTVGLVSPKSTFECEGLHDGEWTASQKGTLTRIK